MEVAITPDKHFKISYITPHFMFSVEQVNFTQFIVSYITSHSICRVEQVNFVICMTYNNYGESFQDVGDE